MFKRACGLLGILALAGAALWAWANAEAPIPPRSSAEKLMRDGNFKDAYEAYRKIVLDAKADRLTVGPDLQQAVQCLQNLGREEEQDDFRELAIANHADNWRLLDAAATSYQHSQHFGYIVAGKFYRGHKRGGGKYVSAMMRDRVRALQLMNQALPLIAKENDKAAAAQFHMHFAELLIAGGGYHEPWRLQYLTDLTTLPDYEEGYYGRGRYGYGGNGGGAPVDADGKPVYHYLPESYEKSTTDGQRWRWMQAKAAELNPSRATEIKMGFADFLRSQFDTRTMAQYGRGFGRMSDDDPKKNQSGTYALHTLGEDETIARLATGVQRFKLPDEFNYLKIYQQVADAKGGYGSQAIEHLCEIFEDRRQYVKAADYWRRAIKEYGAGGNRQQRLDQIVGNWGRFEGLQPMAAGTKATVDFRFRNGKKVQFEAWEINVPKLLADVKAYLKSSPNQLDWKQMNIQDLGYRLVTENQNQYLTKKTVAWNLDVTPRPEHVDDRVTVTTPLDKAGAYLVTGTMEGGNTSRVIVWLNDTVLAKKQLDGQMFYYVADAVSGQPVAKANVEFFGWRQEQIQPNTNRYRVVTTNFAENTDKDGQLLLGQGQVPTNYQWLIMATTGQGRLAYLGFTGAWYGRQYDAEYNQTKVFGITDRPVYRPLQKVEWKVWVEHAKYDEEDKSAFAGQRFQVHIYNPKGEKIHDAAYTADEFGGIDGSFALSKDVTLGVYSIQLPNHGGATSFRVEEYKKPEFEVKIEAPKEPVALGEKITATIQAKYYFGAPVTSAKVKYKVLRNSHTSHWYPVGDWDWCYGRGYWWFAADYLWYPGFRDWGCCRPLPWWAHRQSQPPEVVMENEVPIGPDGTVRVEINTLAAKELHGDEDHKYSITAEVVDESRRTIVGQGDVLVARKPFKVHSWVNRGHYRAGDVVQAHFSAHTLDQKPVQGKGELVLYKISYNAKNEPVEAPVEKWSLDTNVEGQARQQLKAAQPGQYRLSFRVTDSKKHTIEGGYLFVVRGDGFDGKDFRFNDLELVTDKREYAPGENVNLMINTNRTGAAVVLFIRPTNGVALPPKIVRLQGKSVVEDIAVIKKDMPNFFVEAFTVHDGKIFNEMKEVIVPPEKRILNVQVSPNQPEYLPGQEAKVKIKLTDFQGNPFVGSTVVSIYDRSVEYIAGGSNVPEIKEFFWKWRRHHNPGQESSVNRWFGNLLRQKELGMNNLGVFGDQVVEELSKAKGEQAGGGRGAPMAPGMANAAFAGRDGANREDRKELAEGKDAEKRQSAGDPQGPPGQPAVQPTVRKNFADTALWVASLTTDKNGEATVSLKMPENLTGWRVRCWAMGAGTRVGQGEAEVTTKKNILVRMQAPRFFVEKDEVVLSANVHNYLKKDKKVTVSLEIPGGTLAPLGSLTQLVTVKAGGEQRVDWRVKVEKEGQAIVRMKALTDEESDAMETAFPVYVHGMLKMESFSGVVRPDKDAGQIIIEVPAERRINDSRLEVRYSPTLAGAMVDALPYLVEYPYGCTEQTLNRFVPTVVTQNILQRMKLDLKDIRDKRTNLNALEIGDPKARAKGWKRYERNPVFDEAEVKDMVRSGVARLIEMQLGDGGWGWFSGWGERSFPHTTAVVVHGLQLAKENGAAIPPDVLARGVAWLKNYQEEQVRLIKNAPGKVRPWKDSADNLDAFVYMVLLDADITSNDMMEFLYRDRNNLAVYAKALFGLALQKQKQAEKLAMIIKNCEQYLVQDDENQTAYLRLPAGNAWWNWYGSEIEANAYFLKLLVRENPKDERASRMVKYLLNNRKHSTYWNSTRDTAVAIEAMAEYMTLSGEAEPNLTVEIWLDGAKQKEVKIDKSNLFTFDGSFVLFGDAVPTGKHQIEIRKKGNSPVYFNAYLTNFTLEDFITRAGLEVKVNRKIYKLVPVDQKIKVPGERGQALDQKVVKYNRVELTNLQTLKSGELVEVELEIDSKNDYEYLIFEDMKAAGFEPVAVRSGYNGNDMGAYMELRDDRVSFFIRSLARGKHSVSYRLRAEIPGKFSALPARAYAMYAPELKGNSDEIKLAIED